MGEKFDEKEAARRLTMSQASLSRLRLAGKIHALRLGPRIIRYTQEILDEYEASCRNVPVKSEITGYQSGQGRSNGAEPGTTPALGRHDAHHLAQQIFKKAS